MKLVHHNLYLQVNLPKTERLGLRVYDEIRVAVIAAEDEAEGLRIREIVGGIGR